MASCESGCLDVVEFLFPSGANITDKDKRYRQSPLLCASWNGHLKVVKFLVSKNVSLRDRDINGYSSLKFASSEGHYNVVKYLLSKGANMKD